MFKKRTITPTIVLQIINKTLTIKLPFNINIYTSYVYLREKSKLIASNMIGQYLAETVDKENILHIFITPNLSGEQLFMHQLDITNCSTFYPHSIFSNRHLTEGQKTHFQTMNDSDQMGSNLQCICEHPKTQEFFPPRKYKNLGNNFYFKPHNNIFPFKPFFCVLASLPSLKYYLTEHLGQF